MTSPYVSFPSPAPTVTRPSAWPVLRAILAVVLILIGTVGFVVAGYVAVIVWTGCFIECEGGNHRDGGLLALLAVALLATGPALVALLYRSRAWLWVTASAAAAGTALLIFAIAGN
jgi:hypothetical protein